MAISLAKRDMLELAYANEGRLLVMKQNRRNVADKLVNEGLMQRVSDVKYELTADGIRTVEAIMSRMQLTQDEKEREAAARQQVLDNKLRTIRSRTNTALLALYAELLATPDCGPQRLRLVEVEMLRRMGGP